MSYPPSQKVARRRHRKKAVSYLWVSTLKQVKREYNPEGIEELNKLAAQSGLLRGD
jgi:hypothetical protein